MTKLNLFIDTNIFLDFYHFTKDDIADIDLLIGHIQNESITLHLPEQVKNEWERNREAKLKTTETEFQRIQFQVAIPRHMESFELAESYKRAVSEAKKARDRLVAEATIKARTYSLDIDKKIETLFSVACTYTHDDTILALGKKRAELGNPPGKPGSIGDQYNWEMLLKNAPNEDIYIITKDGDYISPLSGTDVNTPTHPNAFLKNEWNKNKEGKAIYTFKSIKSTIAYLENIIPKIAASGSQLSKALAHEEILDSREKQASTPADALPTSSPLVKQPTTKIPASNRENKAITPAELAEKEKAIQKLITSESFSTTHVAIAQIQKYKGILSSDEANKLLKAAIENQQINWIITDDDVNKFYLWLIDTYLPYLDIGLFDEAIELLDLKTDNHQQEDWM